MTPCRHSTFITPRQLRLPFAAADKKVSESRRSRLKLSASTKSVIAMNDMFGTVLKSSRDKTGRPTNRLTIIVTLHVFYKVARPRHETDAQLVAAVA